MKSAMTRRRFAVLCALAAGPLAAFTTARADDATGQWTVRRSETPGQVYLSLMGAAAHGTFSTSSDWKTADLKGLDLANGKHDVHFVIERDAGRFDADGIASGGEGAGLFRFTPASGYIRAMAAAGFPEVAPDRQLSLAIHDVGPGFAREMKDAGVEGLDLDKLVAFRIHRVDLAYITAMRAQGMKTVNAESWIAFRIHGATPDFVKAVRALGYAPDDRELVTLRIHQVTPEYIAGLKSHGLNDLTLDKIVSLKIHGIG